LAIHYQYFGLTFVSVTNATNYNGSNSSKITISTNNYYYKVVFIFSTILLLSLVILTNPAHATNTSVYKSSESSKKYSLFSSTINNYTANPYIRNSTTALANSVIFSHNLAFTKAATIISTNHASSEVPTLLRGSLLATLPKSNNGNSFFVKDPSHYILVDSNRHHDSSKSKAPISPAFKNMIHNALPHDDDKITRIAFIKPSFTAAAYSHSFYVFYTLYQNLHLGKNVTTNLNLLTSKVTALQTDSSSSAYGMYYLDENIKSIIPKSKIDILTDADVDAGNIFTAKNRLNKYDILIIGHQEYVTQQEYDNLKHFVSSGGTLVILDGNIFY
jgi:hypothetical protein